MPNNRMQRSTVSLRPAEKVQCVITTIARPTQCVKHLHSFCGSELDGLIVMGDRKGPDQFPLQHADFYSLERQVTLDFRLAKMLPENHYSRKNLGFLIAIGSGADAIYETDDDTQPTSNWKQRSQFQKAYPVQGKKWSNIFNHFTDEKIWPRGLPLDEISCTDSKSENECLVDAPIQQGMIDLSPDVDAVWRLVFGQEVFFEARPSIFLKPGTWCPFNSQNTWWRRSAYPLMYLPSHCEFRATDIWRGLIAQRCIWELGCGLVFHGPDSIQHRNIHNLMTDFKGEVSGYLRNQEITSLLASLKLLPGESNVADNLVNCYENLCGIGVFPDQELPLVKNWVSDVQSCLQSGGANKVVACRAA